MDFYPETTHMCFCQYVCVYIVHSFLLRSIFPPYNSFCIQKVKICAKEISLSWKNLAVASLALPIPQSQGFLFATSAAWASS